MPVEPQRSPLAEKPAAGRTALLVVDMFSCRDFPDTEALAPAAIASHIRKLKRRCDKAGVPTVFVNDNRGRWRSDSVALVARCAAATASGAAIASSLVPGDADYVVLKPKHSEFFATPLDLLLRHLRVERPLPADCVASQTARRNAAACAI